MTTATSKLDRLLPDYEVNEVHQRYVPADPATVYAAALAVTAREIRLLAPLWFMRSLPARLTGARWRSDRSLPFLELFARLGAVRLDDGSDTEILLGAVGRFWSLRGNRPIALSREELLGFERPGYTQFLTNLVVVPDGAGARVVTETRCVSTSREATRAFRRYWLLIRLGSGAIRRSWLAAIARRATAASR